MANFKESVDVSLLLNYYFCRNFDYCLGYYNTGYNLWFSRRKTVTTEVYVYDGP